MPQVEVEICFSNMHPDAFDAAAAPLLNSPRRTPEERRKIEGDCNESLCS
jgi:hypothetical protein